MDLLYNQVYKILCLYISQSSRIRRLLPCP